MEYGFSPILLDREICRDFSCSSRLEWLNTNQTGGYAMGAVAGLNTRRYHGLLVAALDPPFQRYVTLSKIDEQVQFADSDLAPSVKARSSESKTFDLATSCFKGGLLHRGYELLDLFRLDPYPIWRWALGDANLTRRVFLIDGKPAVAILYTSDRPCTVLARPYLAYRDYHKLMHVNDLLNATIERGPDYFRISPYPGLPPMRVRFGSDAEFQNDGKWERDFHYSVDEERGMDADEDLYSPGVIRLRLQPDDVGWIVAELGDGEPYGEEQLKSIAELYRRKEVKGNTPFEARLTAASDQFRAEKQDGSATLLAGFPWFASWGRDAMISLPGLVITRGMFDFARETMEGFLKHINQGLIPNFFPDVGPPEYNAIDATLWMFQAVWSYVQCGGGMSWVKDVFYPIAKEILSWHERGTLYEIQVDSSDGLLRGGVEGTMLTWMDAKVGDWVVTPRRGKPVEVNALWYNALRMMLHWAAELEDLDYGHKIREMARQTQQSFNRKFWNAERECAYDVLEPPNDKPDAKLRPNQILAVSLPFPLFEQEQREKIVRIVERELLTPYGLRSLDRGDPEYRPRYEGDRQQRDGAYHNGTVWPWLIGPYITAYLRTFGKSDETVAHCRGLVQAFEPLIAEYGLGSIPEIVDGDAPHHSRGCIAQAFSVAELLRVLRAELA